MVLRGRSVFRLQDGRGARKRLRGIAGRDIFVREVLNRKPSLSIGVVAFSQAQRVEIDKALNALAATDRDFRNKLDLEEEREHDGQYVGLFVKNLENVQGDERDVMIVSVCYGPDAKGRMIMNFGPINQEWRREAAERDLLARQASHDDRVVDRRRADHQHL